MKRFVRLKTKLLCTAGVLVIYSLLYVFHVPCLYKALFRISCAGCGMSRAWLCVLQGELDMAFSLHPLFWSVPILYLYILADGHLVGCRWVDRTVLAVLLGAFGVLAVLRLTVPAMWV